MDYLSIFLLKNHSLGKWVLEALINTPSTVSQHSSVFCGWLIRLYCMFSPKISKPFTEHFKHEQADAIKWKQGIHLKNCKEKNEWVMEIWGRIERASDGKVRTPQGMMTKINHSRRMFQFLKEQLFSLLSTTTTLVKISVS